MAKEIQDLVKLEYENGVAWVTFNRPEKRNALSPNISRRNSPRISIRLSARPAGLRTCDSIRT